MTWKQWARRAGGQVHWAEMPTGLILVHSTDRKLWSLRDYCVSSQMCGTVFLRPRNLKKGK